MKKTIRIYAKNQEISTRVGVIKKKTIAKYDSLYVLLRVLISNICHFM